MLIAVLLVVLLGGAVAAANRGGASSGSPDPGMSAAEWGAVQTALQQETDPQMLDAFANVLDSQGFTRSASLLRQKAIAIG